MSRHFYSNVDNVTDAVEPFRAYHFLCLYTFSNKLEEGKKRELAIREEGCSTSVNVLDTNSPRPKRGKLSVNSCFICDEKRSCDKNQYNQGGLSLGATGIAKAKGKIIENEDLYLTDPNNKCHAAAKRLDVMLGGSADRFAAEIYTTSHGTGDLLK